MELRKTEKEMDRRRQVQHGGLHNNNNNRICIARVCRMTSEAHMGNRAECRRQTRVADPSTEGFTA